MDPRKYTSQYRDYISFTHQTDFCYDDKDRIRNMVKNQKTMLEGLDEIRVDINKFKQEIDNTYPKPNDNPVCLQPYQAKSSMINNIPIQSLLADLQYHLGLLDSPGTPDQLSSFKEGSLIAKAIKEREKSYSMETFKQFIHSDCALVKINMTEGVKSSICQLAVHSAIDGVDRKKCVELLSRSEILSPTENYLTQLAKYQLEQTEAMLFRQQAHFNKQLKIKSKIHTKNINHLQNAIDQMLLTQANILTKINNMTQPVLYEANNSSHFFNSSIKSQPKTTSQPAKGRNRSFSI